MYLVLLILELPSPTPHDFIWVALAHSISMCLMPTLHWAPYRPFSLLTVMRVQSGVQMVCVHVPEVAHKAALTVLPLRQTRVAFVFHRLT